MASTVSIANLALDCIGARSTISSLTENSTEARIIARQYSQALDDVLQAAHWNFARKQGTLALLKDGTLSPPDAVPQPWIYEYAYPVDCVQGRYIMPSFQEDATGVSIFGSDFATGTGGITQSPPVRFIISSDVDDNDNPVKVILTNQPQAQLVYTARITDPLMFDGMFIRAFANYLGALICIGLSGDKALARGAFDVADRTTRAARASNGNESITIIDSMPDWLSVRGLESQGNSGIFIQSPTDLSFIA